jgi:hypothetical protein
MWSCFVGALGTCVSLVAFAYIEAAKRVVNPRSEPAALKRGHALASHGWYTPQRYWRGADIVLGLVYLSHYAYAAVYLAHLLAAGRFDTAGRFMCGFALFGAAYFATLVLWPVSPPWFALEGVLGPARHPEAGFARFDELLGCCVFRNLYARSTVVHGAFPSGHAAWSLLVLVQNAVEPLWPSWLTFAHSALMAFAAIYSLHHYVLDCTGALVYVLFAVGLAHMFA